MIKELGQRLKRKIKKTFFSSPETDALYRLLYELVQDKEESLSLSSKQTKKAFAFQWKSLPEGDGLLSDPWFRSNVTSILTDQELLIKPEWFAGKEVLDAGCGNGRWSYAFSKLGAKVTAVDINAIALEETKKNLSGSSIQHEFYQSPLEILSSNLPAKKFDVVFSWGVLHHCQSFNKALQQLFGYVKEGGVLYLYLYGRESISYADDIDYFKQRVIYNSLPTIEDKQAFLLKKARGNTEKLHIYHDIYAPLVNRRLEFQEVKETLVNNGFQDVIRTIDHTELFIRAFKGPANIPQEMLQSPKAKPYWFERYN